MNVPDTTVVSEIQYFPPVSFFTGLDGVMHVVFEQYESFQKMSFRNRMIIAGPVGPVLLSIPIAGGRDQKCMMKDILIDNNSKWQKTHWKTIVSCYNRSPWFEHYSDDLLQLFETRFDRLMDWNLHCFNWVSNKIGLSLSVSLTDEWRKSYETENCKDWRNRFGSQTLKGISPVVRYRQVFEERTGFIPHLSILDLLFARGGMLRRFYRLVNSFASWRLREKYSCKDAKPQREGGMPWIV